jgi:hypothetical protein
VKEPSNYAVVKLDNAWSQAGNTNNGVIDRMTIIHKKIPRKDFRGLFKEFKIEERS